MTTDQIPTVRPVNVTTTIDTVHKGEQISSRVTVTADYTVTGVTEPILTHKGDNAYAINPTSMRATWIDGQLSRVWIDGRRIVRDGREGNSTGRAVFLTDPPCASTHPIADAPTWAWMATHEPAAPFTSATVRNFAVGLPESARTALREALRDLSNADASEIILDGIRDALAEEMADDAELALATLVAVTFQPSKADNGYFFGTDAVAYFRQGDAPEGFAVDFEVSAYVEEAIAEMYGCVGDDHVLFVDPASGVIDLNDIGRHMLPRHPDKVTPPELAALADAVR